MGDKQLNVLNEFENLNLFDNKGNKVYSFVVHSDDSWEKTTWDEEGNESTYENSEGVQRGFVFIIPEHTMEELIEKIGYNFKIKK